MPQVREKLRVIFSEFESVRIAFFQYLAHLIPSKHHTGHYIKKDPIVALFLIFTLASPALAFFPDQPADIVSADESLEKGLSEDQVFKENARRLVKDNKIETDRGSAAQAEGSDYQAPTLTVASEPANVIPPVADPAPKKSRIVSGWLPNWDMGTGLKSMTDNPDIMNELSPFWYELTLQGSIKAANGTGNAHVLSVARQQGQIVIPTIHNNFEGDRVERLIGSIESRDRLVNEIVDITNQNNYDGIDIDFEAVSPEYRVAFTGFVQVLGQRMHESGKLLSVTVMPKTSEPGSPYGASSQDYAAIAASADRVRIMAYDNHYQGGDPGPVAPANWVDELLAFAVTVIPREKLVLGVPSYGYDWAPTGGKTNGRAITYEKAISLANQHQRPIDFDGIAFSPVFTYDAGGVKHYVWFENARSLSVKLDLVNKYDIGGIAIWRLGREDPGSWNIINDKIGS